MALYRVEARPASREAVYVPPAPRTARPTCSDCGERPAGDGMGPRCCDCWADAARRWDWRGRKLNYHQIARRR